MNVAALAVAGGGHVFGAHNNVAVAATRGDHRVDVLLCLDNDIQQVGFIGIGEHAFAGSAADCQSILWFFARKLDTQGAPCLTTQYQA